MADHPLALQLQPALVQLSEFMAQIFAAFRQLEAAAGAAANTRPAAVRAPAVTAAPVRN
jgi:hypothetical protein